ncbi:Hypothetical predicted protein [Paramuricea clavata]|uniref:Uncharacterized protein n=1 Tax=Paramuricea clavata TaxID=317549 RepID=A0A6S7IDT7_PARCT|nr:Hypothetical predicted protein [Paramuricea clavata]
MCERVLEKVSKTDAPQSCVLLEELVSVTEKVKATSSALLFDAKKTLDKGKPCPSIYAAEVNEFVPISKEPGSRRRILTDQDREFMINLGPFQHILEITKFHSPSIVDSLLSVLTNFRIWSILLSRMLHFCFVCHLFPTGAGHEKSNDVWIGEGVRQWHKMKSRGKSKQGKLPGHFGSNSHKASFEALHMDKAHMTLCIEAEAEKKKNREAVKILIDIVRFLVSQGLALRGHGAESDANGNFHQLLWQTVPDTAPDTSHLDQLSVVLRYVTPSCVVRDRLVDIRDIDSKTGDGQATAILESLRSKEFNTESIVFQSYDYTYSTSGKFKGCQAKMTEYYTLEMIYVFFTSIQHQALHGFSSGSEG